MVKIDHLWSIMRMIKILGLGRFWKCYLYRWYGGNSDDDKGSYEGSVVANDDGNEKDNEIGG